MSEVKPKKRYKTDEERGEALKALIDAAAPDAGAIVDAAFVAKILDGFNVLIKEVRHEGFAAGQAETAELWKGRLEKLQAEIFALKGRNT